jgi:hypothetical protein
MPGGDAISDVGRSLIDHRHVDQPSGAAGVGTPACFAARASGARHAPRQLPGQSTPGGLVNRLANGLWHQVAVRLAGELPAQRLADLLRAPPLLKALHELGEHRVADQLAAPVVPVVSRPGAGR